MLAFAGCTSTQNVDPNVAHMSSLDPVLVQTAAEIASPCPCMPKHYFLDDLKLKQGCRESTILTHQIMHWIQLGLPTHDIISAGNDMAASLRQPWDFDNSHSPRLNDAKNPVEITIFSDFECPACQRAAPVLHEVAQNRRREVSLVMRHFPIPGHANAPGLAALAILADKFDHAFWPAHDLIFGITQEELSLRERVKKLSDLYLKPHIDNLSAEESATKSDELAEFAMTILRRDQQEGKAAGVAYVPSIFINGTLLPIGGEPGGLNIRIDDELKLGPAVQCNQI